ncbi:MAG: hypothetical protein EHM20_17825 [Alphaproteobacteria bacterium]|nr:MAG: hypothetical protein EHM20_17825 [Alphaproteobacteria bacterium]
MASVIKKVKQIKQIIKSHKKKTIKTKESLSSKLYTSGAHLSLDDPQNELFDDEIYDELVLPDESLINNEKSTFEQPW